MRKFLLLIMISAMFSINNINMVFGEIEVQGSNAMDYFGAIIFINGMPLQLYYDGFCGYSISPEVDGIYRYYVLSKDLERCGFAVSLDKEAAVLSIKKIPGKQPDRLSEEEYQELLKKIKDNANGESICANETNLTVSFDGIPWKDGGNYYLDGSCFILVDRLVQLYGSQWYERPQKELYLTISYDYPVARTVYSAYAYPFTQSFEDYWMKKAGKYQLLIMSIDNQLIDDTTTVSAGIRQHFETFGVEGNSYHASYMPIELIIEKYKLQYSFTENALFLEKGQALQKKEVMQDAIEANADDEYRYKYIMHDWQLMSTFACVDLKLISGGEEYTEERDFPIFISIDGNIYMDIGALANVLKE